MIQQPAEEGLAGGGALPAAEGLQVAVDGRQADGLALVAEQVVQLLRAAEPALPAQELGHGGALTGRPQPADRGGHVARGARRRTAPPTAAAPKPASATTTIIAPGAVSA